MGNIKSLAEHVISIEDMAKFSFFYAARYLPGMVPDKSLAEALFDHTPLLFHGLNYREKEHFAEINLCRMLADGCERFAGIAPTDFEQEMWNLCGDAIKLRAEELYEKSRGVATPPGWNCGSLKYDMPEPEEPHLCRFHIYNTVSPASVFDDPEYLILCFKLMMKECELRFNADTLITSTWLNEHPRWLEFFPEEFRNSFAPRKTDYVPNRTVGSWGFLYDRRGCMNMKYIRQIRENGVLPFIPRTGRCSFELMRRHLDALIEHIQNRDSGN